MVSEGALTCMLNIETTKRNSSGVVLDRMTEGKVTQTALDGGRRGRYLVTTVAKVLEVKEGEGLFVVLEC